MKKITLSIILTFAYLAASFAQKTKDNNEPIKSSLTAYEKYIDTNNDAHLKEFMELVSIPSISSIPSNKPDVEKAAVWIVNKLKAIGDHCCFIDLSIIFNLKLASVATAPLVKILKGHFL